MSSSDLATENELNEHDEDVIDRRASRQFIRSSLKQADKYIAVFLERHALYMPYIKKHELDVNDILSGSAGHSKYFQLLVSKNDIDKIVQRVKSGAVFSLDRKRSIEVLLSNMKIHAGDPDESKFKPIRKSLTWRYVGKRFLYALLILIISTCLVIYLDGGLPIDQLAMIGILIIAICCYLPCELFLRFGKSRVFKRQAIALMKAEYKLS